MQTSVLSATGRRFLASTLSVILIISTIQPAFAQDSAPPPPPGVQIQTVTTNTQIRPRFDRGIGTNGYVGGPSGQGATLSSIISFYAAGCTPWNCQYGVRPSARIDVTGSPLPSASAWYVFRAGSGTGGQVIEQTTTTPCRTAGYNSCVSQNPNSSMWYNVNSGNSRTNIGSATVTWRTGAQVYTEATNTKTF